MLYRLNLDEQTLVTEGLRSTITQSQSKRSTSGLITIQIIQNGVIRTSAMSEGFGLKFVAKTEGHYDQDPPHVTVTDFTWDASSGQYQGYANWASPALDDLFKVNDNEDDDVQSVPLDVAIAYRMSEFGDWTEAENRVRHTLFNNVIRADDGAPADPGDTASNIWLKERTFIISGPQTLTDSSKNQGHANAQVMVTSLTGGGAGALDALVTADLLPTGFWQVVIVGGVFQVWVLTAGTDAEDDSGGIVRPDDYDGSTNARVWKQAA